MRSNSPRPACGQLRQLSLRPINPHLLLFLTIAMTSGTGWSGDASFASESELVDFDTAAFFTQFLTQIQQLQCSDGTVESCIPNTDPHSDGPPAPLPCVKAEADPSWGTM